MWSNAIFCPQQNFEMFRKEMDKLGKKLRIVERECTEWKEKFDGSNEQVGPLLVSYWQQCPFSSKAVSVILLIFGISPDGRR